MWFKITLAKDGAIRSCEEVSRSLVGSDTVVYIEADSKAQAIERLRKQWKARYRARVYNERKALGICVHCNEPRAPDSTLCPFHRDKQKVSYQKTCDKKRTLGLTLDQPIPAPLDGRTAQQAQMQTARKESLLTNRLYGVQPNGLLNIRTLLIVQANFRQLAPHQFDKWLQEQIDEYRDKQIKRKGRAA